VTDVRTSAGVFHNEIERLLGLNHLIQLYCNMPHNATLRLPDRLSDSIANTVAWCFLLSSI